MKKLENFFENTMIGQFLFVAGSFAMFIALYCLVGTIEGHG